MLPEITRGISTWLQTSARLPGHAYIFFGRQPDPCDTVGIATDSAVAYPTGTFGISTRRFRYGRHRQLDTSFQNYTDSYTDSLGPHLYVSFPVAKIKSGKEITQSRENKNYLHRNKRKWLYIVISSFIATLTKSTNQEK